MNFQRYVLMGGMLVLSSRAWASTLYNTMAQLPELAKCIFLTRQKFESYEFEPSDFSFGRTGVVYRVRFRPRHALPHMVWATYPKGELVRWKQAEQVMKGFSARLHIKHGQTIREVPPHGGMPIVYRDFQPEGIDFYVGHTLFVFHVGEFGWRYDDEIELMLEVCSPVGQESYLRLLNPRLTVRERSYLH